MMAKKPYAHLSPSWAPVWALALAAALAQGSLVGCGAQTQEPDGAVETQEQASDEGPAGEAAEAAADEGQAPDDEAYVSEGQATLNPWDKECLDRHGDVTAYAVSELEGWQLETLLLQQGYVWSTRNQLWTNESGSVALVVLGADGAELSDEDIAALDPLTAERGVCCRIVTSEYSTLGRAFDALVGNVLTCEDGEFAETSGVAVATGPSGRRMLVMAGTSEDAQVLTLFGEDAVAAGLLDEAAGRELGHTVDEAFETLAGHRPGVRE